MPRTSSGSSPIICQAIQQLRRLAFEYKGLRRIVTPYCYGISTADREVLRATQVAGESHSQGFGFGKLWAVSEMSRLELLDEQFVPSDPNYTPNDSAMTHVICCVTIPASPTRRRRATSP